MKRCLLAWLLVALPAWGQNAAQDQDAANPPTITAYSRLVIVPTLVRNADGDLVQALQSRDFRLTDNGVEQKLSLESVERQPLAMVILMQTGGSAPRQFSAYADLPTMVEYLTGSSAYHIAMVTFDSQPEEQWDFTSNLDKLRDGLTHPERGDAKAAIYDAVNYGIDLLRQQPPDVRRVLLLLSQTHDSGSKARVEDVVQRLGENNVTIYSMSFSTEKTWLKDQFTGSRSGNKPYQLDPDQTSPMHGPLMGTFDLLTPLTMAVRAMKSNAPSAIADLSGGEYMQFGNKRDMEQKLGVLANHIPNRYMLSFRPGTNEPGLHSLRVEIPGHPEWQIAARTTYWASGDSR